MVQLLLILLTFLNFKASFSLSNYLMVIKESKNSQVSALSQIVNYFDISPAEILNHGERTHILKFESTELKIFKMKELINHSKVLDGFRMWSRYFIFRYLTFFSLIFVDSNTSFLRAVKFLEEDLSVTLTSNDAYLETDFMQINDEITGFQSTKSNELRETFVERNPPWNLDRIDQEVCLFMLIFLKNTVVEYF